MSKQNIQQEENKSASPVVKDTKTKKIGGAFINFNTLLSLVIILATGLISYVGWQKISVQKSLIQIQQQQLAQILATQNQLSNQVQNQLQRNSLAQNSELSILKQTITAFIKQNKHSRRDWLVAEAEYLIKLASHRLLLASDVATSIAALRAADERIHEIGNPKFIPLRQALAFDIQQLQTSSRIDFVGLSLKLNALLKHIDALPLKTPDPETIKQRNTPQTQLTQIDNWQQLPSTIWQDLLNLFHIQKYNTTVQALLSPEHRFFLLQNLKLQLEQARLALLNNQPIIYKDRIHQAQQWIMQYFDNQHSLTTSVLETLSTLENTDINIVLPDISSSLTKLQLLQAEQIKPGSNPASKAKSPSMKIKPPFLSKANAAPSI
ncbi:uroporphyrinogen-III C-methyltransferase [Beggiatoa alba]|nr:uroporphyrinogen-III C-methyltransferase [Beggiatoa alba]